jgi:membrane protein
MKLNADKLPRPLRKAVDWVKAVFQEYAEDNGGIVAAAISFYIFISLIPLALVGVSILGYVLGSQERSHDLILQNIRQVMPGPAAETASKLIGGVIAGRAPAGILGLLLLLWSGSSAFANLGWPWTSPGTRTSIEAFSRAG